MIVNLGCIESLLDLCQKICISVIWVGVWWLRWEMGFVRFERWRQWREDEC